MNTIIQTPTPDIKKSLEFYQKLEFKILSDSSPTIISDGKATIMINDDRFARAGLRIYSDNWSNTVLELQKTTEVQKTDNGYLLSDPSNVWLYLIEASSPVQNSINKFNSVLGNSMGLSLETTSIAQSAEFYSKLGFTKGMGDASQGWVTYGNSDDFIVSLMSPNTCPHLFFNPSLTYFNGKENNPKVIDRVRELKIPITEDITHFNSEGIVDNIILRDPGGFGFFVFND
jgi:predicted lactoylglutathione lyase